MGIMSFSAEPTKDTLDFIKEHYDGGTVLDYGCGTGRYTDCFPADKYVGIDGHPENIEFCKKKWPDRKWILTDLEEWLPDKKYDNLFSCVVMEQIDKNLPFGWAKRYMLVEPVCKDCWHDYPETYKPYYNEGQGTEKVLRNMLCDQSKVKISHGPGVRGPRDEKRPWEKEDE